MRERVNHSSGCSPQAAWESMVADCRNFARDSRQHPRPASFPSECSGELHEGGHLPGFGERQLSHEIDRSNCGQFQWRQRQVVFVTCANFSKAKFCWVRGASLKPIFSGQISYFLIHFKNCDYDYNYYNNKYDN